MRKPTQSTAARPASLKTWVEPEANGISGFLTRDSLHCLRVQIDLQGRRISRMASLFNESVVYFRQQFARHGFVGGVFDQVDALVSHPR